MRYVFLFGLLGCAAGPQATFGQMTSAACAGNVDQAFQHVDEARLIGGIEKRAITNDENPDPKAIASAIVSGWRKDIAEKRESNEMCATFVRMEPMGNKQRIEARSPSGITYFYFSEVDGKLKLIDYESSKPLTIAPRPKPSATPSTTATTTDNAPAKIPTSNAKLGDPVRLRVLQYTLAEVKDLGQTMEGKRKPALPGEKRTTKGSFLFVRYSVLNVGKVVATLMEMPKIMDASGREIAALGGEARYMDKDCVAAGLEEIPPSKTKSLCTIFEVPPEAGKLKIVLTDFGAMSEKLAVELP